MSVGYSINQSGLRSLMVRLQKLNATLDDTTRIADKAAEAVAGLFQATLSQYGMSHPNKLGGKRTNWYGQAAKSATHAVTGPGEALASITQPGVRLQWKGGTIYPGVNESCRGGGKTKFLAIPAIAEAHGMSPCEFPNLVFRVVPGHGPALVEAESTPLKRKTVKGRKILAAALNFGGQAGSVGGKVFYWLARKATIGPHPDVLPTQQEIGAEVNQTVREMIKRVVKLRDTGGEQ